MINQTNIVLDWQAPRNRIADSAPALQAALDAGRPIYIPPGIYRIGATLRLPSGTRIEAHPEAVIILEDGVAQTRDDYLLANADPVAGNESIFIEGGIWDGNNRGNSRPEGDLFVDGYTGAMFHFENVSGLTIRNVTLQNAEAYFIRMTAVSHFAIEAIRFGSDRGRPNNDGIHLGGFCEDGVIRDVAGLHPGVTGDDLVALNADDALNRTEVRGMRNGPIRRIRVSGLRATGCHSFVRLLSVNNAIEDIDVYDLQGTCVISAINCDAARGCRVPLFEEDDPAHARGVGTLRNITIRKLRVGKSQNTPVPLFWLKTRMERFSIEDFERLDDGFAAVPTLLIAHVPGTRLNLDGGTSEIANGQPIQSFATRIARLALDSRDRRLQIVAG